MIPSETDHNRYPFLTDFPEVLAFATDHQRSVFLGKIFSPCFQFILPFDEHYEY